MQSSLGQLIIMNVSLILLENMTNFHLILMPQLVGKLDQYCRVMGLLILG